MLIVCGCDIDIHTKTATALDGRKSLLLNIVVFLTVQVLNIVNTGNINIAFPQNGMVCHQDTKQHLIPTTSYITYYQHFQWLS